MNWGALPNPRWVEAMNEEMKPLSKNETLELVPHSSHKKAIDIRWIYKLKYNANGSVNRYKVKYKANGSIKRYKAQLVAKGYTQTHSVHYEQNFAPMAKMMTCKRVCVQKLNRHNRLHRIDTHREGLTESLERRTHSTRERQRDQKLET